MFTQIKIAHDYGQGTDSRGMPYNEITLDLDDPENATTSRGFAVTNVTGLGPGKASTSFTEWAILDGADLNTIKLSKRTITIDLIFCPISPDQSIEELRLLSYRLFPIKRQVRFYIYDDEGRDYFIDGTITKNEPNIWSKSEGASLEIVCPDPFFKNSNYTETSFTELVGIYHFFNNEDPESITVGECPTEPLDVFKWKEEQVTVIYPVSELFHYSERFVDNPSNYECGAILYLSTDGVEVKNPIIYNFTTGETLKLMYTIRADEVIEINSMNQKHSIISNYNGVVTPILQYIDIKNSDFIKLYPGSNRIAISADRNPKFLDLKIRVYPIYVGI
jgi:hypothetical protein